jgi:purine-binding chemotaxis protein CheW
VLVEHEACAIAFSAVREIVRVQRIAPPPPASRHLKGIIELRGRAIPVVDLREKFGLKAEFAERACIVVVAAGPSSATAGLIGLIVDAVEETFTLAAGETEPAPDLGARISTDFLLGTAHVRGRAKSLLDLARVVAVDAFATMAEAV